MSRFHNTAALIGFTVFAVACGTSSQPTTTYPTYQFSCCRADDVNRTWHPGETVELQWTVQPGAPAANSTPYTVILSATLKGPYADVTTLKQLGPVTNSIAGSVVRTNNRTAEPAPVTEIVLPADLPTGFYNLDVKVDSGGGNWYSASTVIHVGVA